MTCGFETKSVFSKRMGNLTFKSYAFGNYWWFLCLPHPNRPPIQHLGYGTWGLQVHRLHHYGAAIDHHHYYTECTINYVGVAVVNILNTTTIKLS